MKTSPEDRRSDRRRRFPDALTAMIRLREAPETRLPVRVADLSIGGCCILLETPVELPEPGGVLGNLEFRYPPDSTAPPFVAEVIVRHATAREGSWAVGCQLQFGNPKDAERFKAEVERR